MTNQKVGEPHVHSRVSETTSDTCNEDYNTCSPTTTCTEQGKKPKSLHIAPMLDISKVEFRKLMRIMSMQCVLWTEMVVDETIAYSDVLDVHLGFGEETHPIICQIGGNNPELIGQGTKIIEEYGYDEVNLNVDCPSNRVSGVREFGAVLMKKIDTTVSIVESMKENARGPISIKCRVGIDDFDDLDYVAEFIRRLQPFCQRFYLHARIAILGGLTPEQNRKVPPLNYPRVYALCELFPDCEFWINGGISGLKAAKSICYGSKACGILVPSHNEHVVPCHLCGFSNGSCIAPPDLAPSNLRGCMLGRAAMDNPSMFWDVDRYFYGLESNPCRNRREVLDKYCQYLETIYPRRCCDRDIRVTVNIPAPDVIVEAPFCPMCRDAMDCAPDSDESKPCIEIAAKPANKSEVKISSRVIDRSLKPVLGMFFGLRNSKTFQRTCHELSRDLAVRNCGPAFILREAMKSIPIEIVDQDFVKTEHLDDSDVPVHASPWDECCKTNA
jgi:tRNA-dihydrouridine synthase A